MTVIVSDYDPDWPQRFRDEAPVLAQALGENALAIEHVGSTSVPGLAAKPVIDILVGVTDLEAVDARNEAMTRAGYEAKGENGIPGRRYFRRFGSDGARLVHVHVFASDSEGFTRHLAFRDYLRVHPERAAAYGALKQALAGEDGVSRAEYAAGKAELVETLEAEAMAWRTGCTGFQSDPPR
jgi:GrpB-like predicted nucleotidyltransferase (UPF0157 family)